jgi:dGTP triphosphohydrolase
MTSAKKQNKPEKLKRFSEEEDQILLEGWYDPKKRPSIIEELGRTKGSLNFRYYQLLKSNKLDPTLYKSQKNLEEHSLKNTNSSQTELLPGVTQVVYGEHVDKKLEQLEKQVNDLQKEIPDRDTRFVTWLENILYMYKQNDTVISMSILMQENIALKKKLEDAESKLSDLQQQFISEKSQHERIYQEIDFWLGQFLRLSSVDKVTSLADFVPRLKTIVDKYGVVLGVGKETDFRKVAGD